LCKTGYPKNASYHGENLWLVLDGSGFYNGDVFLLVVYPIVQWLYLTNMVASTHSKGLLALFVDPLVFLLK
jgi:hypothetical protein